MKNLILIILSIIVFSCDFETVENYSISVSYSSEGFDPHFDSASVKKIRNSDSITYIYDYENLHDGIDTLIFTDNCVYLKGKEPEFIREKEFAINDSKTSVSKYYWRGGHPHGFGIFFINPDLGLISWITANNAVIKYAPDQNQTIISKITMDSLFFSYE